MSDPRDVVIVSGARTATGRFLGSLASFTAPELGGFAIKGAVERAGIKPSDVEEVIMGNVVAAGIGQNPARQAALKAGIPDSVGATTINKVCGSGLKAVIFASQAIKAGDYHCIVAGGMESMSQAPYLLRQARTGYRLGNGVLIDAMVYDGLWDVYNDFHMGNTGELVAEKYSISRREQDEYAYNSHRKAIAAIKAGKFRAEIVPVMVPQKKGDPIKFEVDEGPREDTTVEALARLKPAFRKDGTVTAGNAPGVNDGGSAVVVMSRKRAQELAAKPMARVTGYATGGLEPKWVMMAPVEAVKNLLKATGFAIGDFDLVELNEAFSVQAMAGIRELKLNPEIVNVNGGAVALGHAIGSSGTRVLVSLLYALKDRGKKRGLAALCLGGGNAVALSVEME
ncbi:MAG TPA: acetyl-CoA C-acetyltransferase [bacterium]|nr:acetyl-CoA C-acetyltransferase [bacterium]